MIDFEKAKFIKLSKTKIGEGDRQVGHMLVDGESVFAALSSIRDMVIFTNKRVIAVNTQGITGKKKDFTSLPYSKIQAFSVETAGTFDMDCELTLWFSGLGKVKFEFASNFDIKEFSKLISAYIL